MTKSSPAASIIIPNYNHALFLPDAVQSVLNQSCQDFEIIVVDDGSTDNSREIIEGFGSRVQAIFQENRGLSEARNSGLRAARGAFIGVLDADDMLEPEYLGTLIPLLESQPEVDGAYCGYRFVDETNRPLPQIEARQVPPEKLHQALVDGNFLVPESMFLRRTCYEQAGFFDPSLRALEDLDMWLRITACFRITHTTRVLTRHRILAGSMSTDPTRQFQNRMAVLRKHFGAEPALGSEWTPEQRQAYGRGYLVSAVEYLQACQDEQAYGCVRSMFLARPDLLSRMETFYELACGRQPKGWRGDFASVDLETGSQTLLRLLERLSQDPELPGFTQVKRSAYANARYALGLLAYGQGRAGEARRHFIGALRSSPKFLLNRQFAGFGLRSLAGPGFIRRIKRLAGRAD